MKILLVFMLMVFFSSQSHANGNTFALVCNIEGTILTFHVDLNNHTVQGHSANINSKSISFQHDNHSVYIDRYSGSINLTTYGECIGGSDCRYSGNCHKQKQGKF